MRIASFLHESNISWGVVVGDHLISATGTDYPASVLELIEGQEPAMAVLQRLADDRRADRHKLVDLELLAPIPRPRKNVICLGLNYAAHAVESLSTKELDIEIPEHPVVFTKAVTAVTGPFADIPLPKTLTQQFDWEAELGVIIGRGGRSIKESEALAHVFGYTVINDLTARDLQRRHQQFFLGKSLDGSCPVGPWIVTADTIEDPQNLEVRCWVNGTLKQSGNTKQQLFSVARTISLLSEVMTLEPGDIISTGTPEGVGFARQPPEFLAVGDVVECEVSGIGRIRNQIISAEAN